MQGQLKPIALFFQFSDLHSAGCPGRSYFRQPYFDRVSGLACRAHSMSSNKKSVAIEATTQCPSTARYYIPLTAEPGDLPRRYL
jgi:hypothetical protein